jgi:hypothetical protein
MRLRPLLNIFRRKSFQEFLDCADECRELSPAITLPQNAAVSLPDEFSRARRCYRDEVQHEFGRLQGKQRLHGATLAYRFDNAVVGNGALYASGHALKYAPDASNVFLKGAQDSFDEAVLTTSHCAEVFFGDWLVEALSLELLASEQGWEPVRFKKKAWTHEPGYRALTGLDCLGTSYATVNRLWVVDDRGLNLGRRNRFNMLRSKVRASALAPKDEGSGRKRIYLGRGTSGQPRHLANTDAVISKLELEGFQYIEPEQETPLSLVRKLAEAEIVVAQEGSAHVHALLAMPKSGGLINIQPPFRFTAPGKDMADMAGIGYGFAVADPVEQGFSMDPDHLLKTIDLMIKQLRLNEVGQRR